MNKDDLIIQAFDKLPDTIKRNLPQSAIDMVGDSVSKRTEELKREITSLNWKKTQAQTEIEQRIMTEELAHDRTNSYYRHNHNDYS